MDSSISRAATEKTDAKRASYTLETEPSLKKLKFEKIMKTLWRNPPTTEVFGTVPNSNSAEATANVGAPSPCGAIDADVDSSQIPEGPTQAFKRFVEDLENGKNLNADTLYELKNYINSLTDPEYMSLLKEKFFKMGETIFVILSRCLTLEDDLKKARATSEVTISSQNIEISALKTEMALNSTILAKAEAKLKESELSQGHLRSRVEALEAELKWKDSELSQAHLRSRVEYLEAELKRKESELAQVHLSFRVESLDAELKRKQAENEVLKNQAAASEQKASTAYKELSAATNAIKNFKSSEESQDPDAKLLLYLASSNLA